MGQNAGKDVFPGYPPGDHDQGDETGGDAPENDHDFDEGIDGRVNKKRIYVLFEMKSVLLIHDRQPWILR
jgi:hypothetical protein